MNKLSKRALNEAITLLNKSLNHLSNAYYEKHENSDIPRDIQKDNNDEIAKAHSRNIEAQRLLIAIRDDENV